MVHKTNVPMIRTCVLDQFLPPSSEQVSVQATFVNEGLKTSLNITAYW